MKASLRARALIGIALAIAAYVVFNPSDGDPTIEAAVARRSSSQIHPVGSPDQPRTRSAGSIAAALANRVAGGTAAASLFAVHSWYTPPPPPPPAPVHVLSEQQAAALRTPTAPPIPFAYVGTYTPDGSAPVFFLTQGDRVYNVRVGDTLDNKYSVDAFANGQLVMTYKPLNIQQQLLVGVTP
jgi:hypothetical protein